jgi:peroxiredoxin
MIELGELEAQHGEFEKRNTRVVVVSLDDQKNSQATQADFPHLVVVADTERQLIEAMDVLHAGAGHGGSDTAAPTTFLIDGAGHVRWTFRAERFFTRLSPADVLAAVDQHLGK